MARWEPIRDVVRLRNAVDRMLEDTFLPSGQFWAEIDGAKGIPIDMFQNEKNLVVKASLPGLKPEEVDISITGDTLTIKAEHNEEREAKEDDYFRKERYYGSYSRTVTLPVKVKTDKAEATFENGVLTLTLPKSEEVKPKQIKVKPKAALEESSKKSK